MNTPACSMFVASVDASLLLVVQEAPARVVVLFGGELTIVKRLPGVVTSWLVFVLMQWPVSTCCLCVCVHCHERRREKAKNAKERSEQVAREKEKKKKKKKNRILSFLGKRSVLFFSFFLGAKNTNVFVQKGKQPIFIALFISRSLSVCVFCLSLCVLSVFCLCVLSLLSLCSPSLFSLPPFFPG